MNKNLATFVEGDGFLYKTHPFVKLLLLALISIFVVLYQSLILVLGCALAITVVALINGTDLKTLLKRGLYILALSASLIPIDMFFQSFMPTEGEVIFWLLSPPFLPLRREAVYFAMRTFGWFTTFYMASFLLSRTSRPRDFITGLVEARIPNVGAQALMLAFKFGSTASRDARAVMYAQRLRGRSAWHLKGPGDALNYLKELVSTLLIVTFRRGYHTSISLEKRAFRLHKNPTVLRKIGISAGDVVLLVGTATLLSLGLVVSLGLVPGLAIPALYDIGRSTLVLFV